LKEEPGTASDGVNRHLSRLVAWARNHPHVIVFIAAIAGVVLLVRGQVNDTIAGGVIAIITFAVAQAFDVARRRSEERRWYAEQFLREKINGLRKLFAAMDDWYWTLNEYGNYPPKTFDELRERVFRKERVFLKFLAYAQLYLSPEDDQIVRQAMAWFRQGQRSLIFELPDTEFASGRPRPPDALEDGFPWNEFVGSREAAVAVFSRLLNPRSLQRLEATLEGQWGLDRPSPSSQVPR
jgi:hypothetical protein